RPDLFLDRRNTCDARLCTLIFCPLRVGLDAELRKPDQRINRGEVCRRDRGVAGPESCFERFPLLARVVKILLRGRGRGHGVVLSVYGSAAACLAPRRIAPSYRCRGLRRSGPDVAAL